ncbi:NUDIX domain-containing protein [Ruminococcaceae bacterium YRB3002]|nr:NUDIX domain-containing protein [Ruminococcaceae bacterium YRB3002]
MIIRNCAGGLVFYEDKILLIRNDKHEWSFPKGLVPQGGSVKAAAVSRIAAETGVAANVVAPAGKTSYEFYSVTRMKPVHNNISWFVMKAESDEVTPNPEQGIMECLFVPIEESLDLITYSQDKSLLMMAYQKYKETN